MNCRLWSRNDAELRSNRSSSVDIMLVVDNVDIYGQIEGWRMETAVRGFGVRSLEDRRGRKEGSGERSWFYEHERFEEI